MSPLFAKLAATRPQFAAWLEFCAERGLAPEEVVALLEKKAGGLSLHLSGFHPADIHVPRPVELHPTPVESLHVAGTPHAVPGHVPAGELKAESLIGVRPKITVAPAEVAAAKAVPGAQAASPVVPSTPVAAEGGSCGQGAAGRRQPVQCRG